MKYAFTLIAFLMASTSFAAETSVASQATVAAEASAAYPTSVCTVDVLYPNNTVYQRFVNYGWARQQCINFNMQQAQRYRMRAVWHYQP